MKILLCSDGHHAAENAIRFVSAFAPAWQAEIMLLGIAEQDGDETTLRAALERGADILRQRKTPVEIAVRSGVALTEIRRHTQAETYDLVVIGAARKGASLLSKKAYDLVRELTFPVMVVPESAGRFPPETGQVLMCSGGRECVDPAVQLAMALAGPPRLPVTLLHVLPEAPALYANLAEQEIDPQRLLASRSALARQLRQERDTMVEAGLAVGIVLRQGPVVTEILDEARGGKYALIVMGSAPRKEPVRNYMMGNVAAEVLRDADTAVVILKTRQGEGFFRRLGGLFKRSSA